MRTHTHARTHAHTHTHARTHAHTHTHTHTHTHYLLPLCSPDKPEVTNFTMSQGGESVKGVHVGANVTLTCEAYAYPSPLVEILRDGKKVEGEGGPDDESWYSYKKTVEVSSVTEDHSGGYTCRANITLYQNGEELNITSDELQPQNLIVYGTLYSGTFRHIYYTFQSPD